MRVETTSTATGECDDRKCDGRRIVPILVIHTRRGVPLRLCLDAADELVRKLSLAAERSRKPVRRPK